MSTTPEGKVKKQAKIILDKMGCYYFFPATGGYGASGVPDIVACYKGRFIGIECKAGRNTATALQAHNLDLIHKHGGVALIVREKDVQLLEQMIKCYSAAIET